MVFGISGNPERSDMWATGLLRREKSREWFRNFSAWMKYVARKFDSWFRQLCDIWFVTIRTKYHVDCSSLTKRILKIHQFLKSNWSQRWPESITDWSKFVLAHFRRYVTKKVVLLAVHQSLPPPQRERKKEISNRKNSLRAKVFQQLRHRVTSSSL